MAPSDSPGTEQKDAHLKFPSGGQVREDGADLRVIDPKGEVAAHHLLRSDPSTFTELFFETSAGPGSYQVYFGNPKATPPQSTFQPRAGLTASFYEMGEFPSKSLVIVDQWQREGRIHDSKVFSSYIRRRGKRLSSVTWPKIEFSRPDLVPPRSGLLLYHGWLKVPEDGDYSFSIAADDPAAIILRGEELSAGPGKGKGKQGGVADLNLDIGDEDIEATLTEEEKRARPEAAGKTVLYYPGGRGSFSPTHHATAAHVGKVELRKGLKELFYFQTIWKGMQFAALAWRFGRRGPWEMLGEQHFVEPQRARMTRFEDREKPDSAAFTYQEVNTYAIDRSAFIEVEFEVIAPQDGVEYVWDFGDGVKGVVGRSATHIYVARDQFPVTLSVRKGGKDVARFGVTADVPGRKETDVDYEETIARYAAIMREYPFAELPQEYFDACMLLYGKVHREPASLVGVLKALVDTRTPVKEAGPNPGQFRYYSMPGRRRIAAARYDDQRSHIFKFFMQLAHCQWSPPVSDSAAALRTYERVIKLFPEPYPSTLLDKRCLAKWETGQIQMQSGDSEKARAVFVEVEKDGREGFDAWMFHGGTGKAADQYRYWIRSGLIGQADIALRRGELDRVKELCIQASKVQRIPMRPAVASAKRAAHRTTVEDLLRHRWGEEALRRIRLWEVEFPRDKPKGVTEFLRGGAYLSLRRFERARASLALCRRLITEHDPLLREAQFLDAEALFWSGQRKEADAAFQKIIEELPDSEWAKTARRRLKTLEVIRTDCADEEEPYLVEHTAARISGTIYANLGYAEGWGGKCRIASHRTGFFIYEFPIRKDTERIALRFRKKGITLLFINDEKFWHEPASRMDEDVVDQEILLRDPALWASGKLKLTFRDGWNRWSRYMDTVTLCVDWVELHLLRLE